MSKGMEDPIVSELKKYEQNPDWNGKKAILLFSDAATEALYRLSHKIGTHSDWAVPLNDELQQYTEKLRQNDLRWLANPESN